MNIVSLQFLVFIILLTLVYFLVPSRFRWMVLLAGSIVFYAFAGVGYLLYIGVTILVTYIVGLRLESLNSISASLLSAAADDASRESAKTQIRALKNFACTVALVFSLGIWIVLKYTGFFILNLNGILGLFSLEGLDVIGFVLPLGMSFYTFHAIGYVVDIYRNKYGAEHNFFKYALFVSFFPHIIQGPFSRYDLLGKTLYDGHAFSYDRLCQGLARILWGLFKKLIVADKLGGAYLAVFADYSNYAGVYIAFGIVLHAIRLYADFSGYMDIMCGICHIYGVELAENFKRPYFAKSIEEYWQRWHLTLGKWFRDYLFYPVSMGKTAQKLGRKARKKFGPRMGKLVPGYFALIFVWTATGLWHGANWKYFVWGVFNLVIITSSMQLQDFYTRLKTLLHIKDTNLVWKIFCMVRTFALVCFFRFFSVPDTLSDSFAMIGHMFSAFRPAKGLAFMDLFTGMTLPDVAAAMLGLAMIFFVDLMGELGLWERLKDKTPVLVRSLVYAAMLILLVLFAGETTDLIGGFMYAKF